MDAMQLKGYRVYPRSVQDAEGTRVCMARGPEGDVLLIFGGELGFEGKMVEAEGKRALEAPLNEHNARRLREVFPFTAPRQGLTGVCSMGVGDRLGIATPGHLRVFERHPHIFPILAQQSIRELNLTQRSYQDVLNSASFAVFREGFTRGWGADGDHLKTPQELEYALGCGFTMITLDCSEHIRNDVTSMRLEELRREDKSSAGQREAYMNKTFEIEPGLSVHFDEEEFLRAVLVYNKAIDFMADIYARFINGRPVDFEISIDETMTPTSPLQHYYVASELRRRGVVCHSMAPRFCGEFQKGIDYLGDLAQFDRELEVHAAIARKFGYKISVHSGSDKFSVFPSVGRINRGVFHIKTAGTNWLEAVRLVAIKDPALYRRMHAFALEAYKAASAYYHVKGRPELLPDITGMQDDKLPGLMDQDDARQVLHITYGLILTTKGEDGSSLFRDELYTLWDRYQEDYAALLDGHIGRHAELLFSDL